MMYIYMYPSFQTKIRGICFAYGAVILKLQKINSWSYVVLEQSNENCS